MVFKSTFPALRISSFFGIAIHFSFVCLLLTDIFADQPSVTPDARVVLNDPKGNFEVQLPELLEDVENSVSLLLKSESAKSLEILMVNADCSCTRGKVSSSRLEPGSEIRLNLKILPRSTSATSQVFRATVSLVLGNDAGDSISINLRANLRRLVTIEPTMILVEGHQKVFEAQLKIACDHPARAVRKISLVDTRSIKNLDWKPEQRIANLLVDTSFRNQLSEVWSKLRLEIEMEDGKLIELTRNILVRSPPQIRVAPAVPEFVESNGVFAERLVVSFLDEVDERNLAIEVSNGSETVPIDFEIVQRARNLRIFRLFSNDLDKLVKTDDSDLKLELILLKKDTNSEIFRTDCRLIE